MLLVVALIAVLGLGGFAAYHFRADMARLLQARGAPAVDASTPDSESNAPGLVTPGVQAAADAQSSAVDEGAGAGADAGIDAAQAAQAAADAAASAQDAAAAASAQDSGALPGSAPMEDDSQAADAAEQAADTAAGSSDMQANTQRQLEDAAQQMLDDGEACFARQEYGCAITNASNVLRLIPGDGRALRLKQRADEAQARAMDNIDIQ